MQVSSSSHFSAPALNRHQTGDEARGAAGADNENKVEQLTKPGARTQQKDVAQQLTHEESQQLRLLKTRDHEVRAHEQAHASVGGPFTGAPNYQYTRGPDGRQYASSGHVNIDSSKIAGDPKATLQKALQLKRAALAPAQPSQQDRRVAANAQQLAVEVRADLNALLLKTQETETPITPGSRVNIVI